MPKEPLIHRSPLLPVPNHTGSTYDIPANMLSDVTADAIKCWMQPMNLAAKIKRVVDGFEVTCSIDGGLVAGREVSLVSISSPGAYDQHIHKNSDAIFIIQSGNGTLCCGNKRYQVNQGDIVNIPRGTPHGFEIRESEALTWVSIQVPPIRDVNTGVEDLANADLKDLV